MARRRRGIRATLARLSRSKRRRGKRRRILRARGLWLLLLTLVVAAAGAWWLLRPDRSLRAYAGEALGIQRVERLAAIIEAAAREARVDPFLLAAIVFMESRGRVDAVSEKDALGLMQLVPAAASDAAKRLGMPPPSREMLLSDARLNLRLGANHLAWLLEHRGSWTLEQVLVAYNAGRGKLARWIEDAGGYAAWRSRERELDETVGGDTGALLYAERVLSMRAVFEHRGAIQDPLGLRVE